MQAARRNLSGGIRKTSSLGSDEAVGRNGTRMRGYLVRHRPTLEHRFGDIAETELVPQPQETFFWRFVRSISFAGFAAPSSPSAPAAVLIGWSAVTAATASRAAFWRPGWPLGACSGTDQKR